MPSFELVDCVKQYPNLAVNLELLSKGEKFSRALGWVTTAQSRGDLQGRLRELNAQLFHAPELIVSIDLLEEYRTFVKNIDKSNGDYEHYAAASGCYDDLVMAMAGAMQFDRMYSEYPPAEIPKVDPSMSTLIKHRKAGLAVRFKPLGTKRAFAR